MSSPQPQLERLHALIDQARAQLGRVILGQQAAIDQALVVILCGGHALIEGVPGVAKTLLVRTLARVLGCPFGRIQFTPDLMPADITGTSVFDLRRNEFSFVPGPLFTSFLLADEINRAPAKTQAALLEAMQERTITVDRTTHPLPPTFTVFATQNPIEYEGTYPLPEAQKDRFLLKIPMGHPSAEDELGLAVRTLRESERPEAALAGIQPVLGAGQLEQVRPLLEGVVVREEVMGYCVGLVRATRTHDSVLAGAGPRATQALVLTARARAALDGRTFVTPDDVKAMALPVIGHRVVLRPEYEIEGLDVGAVVERIVATVKVPR